MKATFRRVAAAVGVVTLVVIVPTTAGAATSGRDYGQHVSACAQEMNGFDATHNPGMHRGFTGWDGGTCTD